ncbi:MAG: hypothetical protein M1836_006519 [Candelina mexicana]|nr:MAG: hypothetical protein M1836_006519 [Candelina mexicana]
MLKALLSFNNAFSKKTFAIFSVFLIYCGFPFTLASIICAPLDNGDEVFFGEIDKDACKAEIYHELYHTVAPLYPDLSAADLAWWVLNVPSVTTLELLGVGQLPHYFDYPRKLVTPKFLSPVFPPGTKPCTAAIMITWIEQTTDIATILSLRTSITQIIDQCVMGGYTRIGFEEKIGIYVYAADSKFAQFIQQWTACPDCGQSDCPHRLDSQSGCLTAPAFIDAILASSPEELGLSGARQIDLCSVGYTSKPDGCCNGWTFSWNAMDIGKAILQFGTRILMNAGKYGWCEFGGGELWSS